MIVFKVIACHILAVILLLAVGCTKARVNETGYYKDLTPDNNGETWK